MMGYELVDLDDDDELERLATMKPRRYAIQPQQLLLADALNAPGYSEYVVEIVRRASKTTTIFCWCLGRCASRPDYFVTFSAQSGVKGTARLREWKTRLDRTCPDPEADLPPWKRGLQRVPARAARHAALFGDDALLEPDEPTGRGFRIMMGEVAKGIYFDNGSQFLVLKPDADAYRGEAGDISWVDEAQELDPEEGEDFFAGILPLQDTREDPALVISGTAGEARVGPFWARVNRLRSRAGNIGGVDYCAPEDTDPELLEDWKTAKQLLLSVHPGIGTLTTTEKMRDRWEHMGRPQWAREYLSLWPETYGTAVVPSEWWTRAALAKPKPIPARVAFAFDVRPGGSAGAIAAAWRDSRGVAHVSIVDHRAGTSWIPARLQELSIKYRGSTAAFDAIGEQLATATEAERLKPKPRLRVQRYREHAAGCVQLLRDLERNKLRHFGHPGLTYALEHAAKREVRNENGIWLWTGTEPGADVSPLIAATRALRNWDQYFDKSAGGAMTPFMGE